VTAELHDSTFVQLLRRPHGDRHDQHRAALGHRARGERGAGHGPSCGIFRFSCGWASVY